MNEVGRVYDSKAVFPPSTDEETEPKRRASPWQQPAHDGPASCPPSSQTPGEELRDWYRAQALISSFLQPIKKEYSLDAHLCPIQGSFIGVTRKRPFPSAPSLCLPFLRKKLVPGPGLLGNSTLGLMPLQHMCDTRCRSMCKSVSSFREQKGESQVCVWKLGRARLAVEMCGQGEQAPDAPQLQCPLVWLKLRV